MRSENSHDKKMAQAVAALAEIGAGELGEDAECCAFCAGIKMDVAMPPVSAGKLLRAGRGCPLSIIAYRAAAESRKGFEVDVVPQPGGSPLLMVNGDEVDALKDYRETDCGCGE